MVVRRYLLDNSTPIQIWWHRVQIDYAVMHNLLAQYPATLDHTLCINAADVLLKIAERSENYPCPHAEIGALFDTTLTNLRESYYAALAAQVALSDRQYDSARVTFKRLRHALTQAGIVDHALT